MIDPSRICLSCFAQLHEPQGVCPRCGFDNAACENAANQLECGSILAGTYLVGRSLGQGGFGITYAGFDLNLNLKVAIKEYFPSECVTRDNRTHATVMPLPGERKAFFERGKERFVSEAQTLARFSDDSAIVNVRGFFYENGTAYIVMSFVEGETLKAYAEKRGGKLPASEVLALMWPVFRSLSRVHEAELLHRDISPDNIMRRADGSPVLIDFGAARQISAMGEHSNSVILKRGFAPVEQYHEHGEQGPWTDVYALCATIYRLTTGKTPPEAGDRLLNDTPLIPPNTLGADFSPAAQAAILHGLAVRASERTKTITQLQNELYSQQMPPKPKPPVPPVPPIPTPPPVDPSIKKKIIIGVAAAAVLTIALLLILMPKGQDGSQGAATEPQDAVVTMAPDTAGSQGYAQPTLEPAVPTMEPSGSTESPHSFGQVGSFTEGRLAAGSDYCLVLLDRGKVACFGGQTTGVYEDVQQWEDIVWISGYDSHAVGLRSNGTLAIAGTDEDNDLDVLDLSNVKQVVTGCHYTAVLTGEGKVYFRGVHLHNLTDCEKWSNVRELIGGDDHLAALFNDGTMKAVGYSGYGQLELGDVTDAVGGTVSSGTTYILHEDGSVTPRGKDFCNEDDVRGWSDILFVDGGDEHTLGLKRDGTIKIAGTSDKNVNIFEAENWTDIVAVCSGKFFIIAIDKYGTIHITGDPQEAYTSGDGVSIWDL